jgi:rsbT co-antagonist protein RsbR
MAAATHAEADQLVPHEMEITAQEVDRRKAFLEFGREDVETLQGLNEIARKYADPVIDDLYRHFLSFEETRAFFQDPKVLERVKRL